MPWTMRGSTMGNLYPQKHRVIIEGHQHFTIKGHQVKAHSKHAVDHARLHNGQFIPTKTSCHYRGTSTFYRQATSNRSPFQACHGPCKAPNGLAKPLKCANDGWSLPHNPGEGSISTSINGHAKRVMRASWARGVN